jgi:predicted DNA-binding transcriptional regulator YafY
MKIFEYIDRINLLHKLIKEKRTGTPEELAKRVSLSKSRLCRVIEDLKLKGVPVAYSRQSQTYYYTNNYKMHINLEFMPLDSEDAKEINGGCWQGNTFCSMLFLCAE